ALKQIQKQHADNTESRARFLLEAEITGGLEHPGIVPVYGLGTYADGRPFYAMRFIRGDSLMQATLKYHKARREVSTTAASGRTNDETLRRDAPCYLHGGHAAQAQNGARPSPSSRSPFCPAVWCCNSSSSCGCAKRRSMRCCIGWRGTGNMISTSCAHCWPIRWWCMRTRRVGVCKAHSSRQSPISPRRSDCRRNTCTPITAAVWPMPQWGISI